MQDVFAATGTDPLEEASRARAGPSDPGATAACRVTAAEGAAELVRQQHTSSSRTPGSASRHSSTRSASPASRPTARPSIPPPSPGARRSTRIWSSGWPPRSAATWRALGVHQGLSPVLDVVRDYRWGRVEETIGEDPYLVAMLGAAYVRGLQSAGVIATLKHFAGYSASRGGRNHGPVSMGRRELLDVILPPFEMARRGSAARGSVMNSYSDVDGVPAGADPWLLTDVLRGEWGFTARWCPTTGRCRSWRRCTGSPPTPATAGALALAAGIDVELPDTIGFGARPGRRGASRATSTRLVDRAAAPAPDAEGRARPARPGLDAGGSVRDAAATDLDSARATGAGPRDRPSGRSCCSTRDGAAPARDRPPALRRIAVVGPCADDPQTFMGCYAFPNHVLPRYPRHGLGIDVPSGVDALRDELADVRRRSTSRAARCPAATGPAFAAAVDAARGGRSVRRVRRRPGRPVRSRHLRRRLRRRGPAAARRAGRTGRRAARTGTPVVVVVVSGRPYALGEIHGRAAGLVQAFMPGEEGGAAIAGVLSGRVQPGGKLPGADPAARRRSAQHLSAATAGWPESRRHQQPRRHPAVPVRARHARTPRSRSATCG